MSLTTTFEKLEASSLEWVTQLDAAAESDDDNLDIAQIANAQKGLNKTLQSGMDDLSRQFDASVRTAKAMEDFVNAIKRYIKKRAGRNYTTVVIRPGGIRDVRITADRLHEMSQLTEAVNETLRLLKTAQTTLGETMTRIQEISQLSDDALNELIKAKKREEEERLRRQEEEKLRREEEERQRKEEEERKRREEEERRRRERQQREEDTRRRREEEERKRREEEERRRREEEERIRREEEARRAREEAERKIREEEERIKREEAERLRRIEEERKIREEEERRLREEEERRRKAEERRLRREEKERRRKEKAEAERLEREELNIRLRKIEEEQRLREEETRWPAIVLIVIDSRLHTRHGCAIRAPEGSLISDEFRCTTAPELIKYDSFAVSEEVVGNVIRLEANGRSELGSSFKGRRAEWLVSLPHCAQRTPGRETVLYLHKNDSWLELPTNDIQLDSLPSEHSWVETRISEPSAVLVPVNRWKINRFTMTKEGVELVSPLDSRIRLNIPPSSFTTRNSVLEQSFEARPVAASVIDYLRKSRPGDFSEVVAVSALVKHSSSAGQIVPMAMTYSLHVPRSAQKQIAAPQANTQQSVPKSAGNKNRSVLESTNSDTIVIASIDNSASEPYWKVHETIDSDEAADKEKLAATFASLDPNRQVVALRVTQKFDLKKMECVGHEIEVAIDTQIARLIVGQSADSRDALVALPSAEKVQDTLDILKGMDFHHVAPPDDPDAPTVELRVKERQQLQIELKGNLTSEEGDTFEFMFHSQLRNDRRLRLLPRDVNVQKSQEKYRGFVQAFSEFQPTQLAKVALQLTKPQNGSHPMTPRKAPFGIRKPRDAVTNEYLQYLASKLGDDWPILAEKLGLSKERCSAIKNNGLDVKDQALEMLFDWFKTTPCSTNKAQVLSKALQVPGVSGFNQLSVDLQQRQMRLQERSNDSDSDTERSFTSV